MTKIPKLAMAMVTLLFFLEPFGCDRSDSGQPPAGAAATVAEGRPLNVGYIPYDDIVGARAGGRVGGLMVDVLNASLAAKGYDPSKVVYHETTWDAFWVGLDAGKYDLCIAGTFRTPQREVRVDFTDPLFWLGNGALVRAGDERFASLVDVDAIDRDGTRVAVVLGEYGYEYARAHFNRAKLDVIPGADLTLAPLAVLQSRDDVAMSDQYVLRKFANLHPETRDALADHPYNVLPICWSVRKGDAVDLDYWNAGIRALEASGQLAQLKRKYDHEIPFAARR